MSSENLIYSLEAGIALITINRPEARNAIDLAMWKVIDGLITDAGQDDDVHILVFTGAGDEAFAAGSDISWLRDRSMLDSLPAYSQGVLQRLEQLMKPSIAAVNGYALGGGCELALACDLRFASENARFGQPEVRLGILPGAGGTQRLARLVGVAKAKELIFSGDIIDAHEAGRIGLVNHVVPHQDLLDSTRAYAQRVMQRGPLAVRLSKLAINAGVDYGPGAGYVIERLAQTVIFGTEDRKEGTSAFLEKRKPDFKSR